MSAVVRAGESLPTPATDTGSLLEVIRRAAADPSVDMDKMERLLAMKERMDAREAETAFNQALNAAQAEVGRIAADATNPQTHSKYATYAKLDKVLRPIYTRHGFALSFDETDSPKPEHIRVLCHVTHSAGHTKTYQKDMPADGKGAKGGDVMTKTHATGAASSYGARYILKGIFNVAIGEEDRDGNDSAGPTISDKQVADLDALLTEVGANKAAFLKFLKVAALSELPAKNYAAAVAAVEAKRKRA
jgi:hypothetical protein